MADCVLTLNAGSSSLKFALFSADVEPRVVFDGAITGLRDVARLFVKGPRGKHLADEALGDTATHEHALQVLLDWLGAHESGHTIVAAGHRVVHGGARFTKPVLLGVEDIAALEQFVPLAPLHQPHNIEAIQALRNLHPDLPQVACFDTAFHHTQPSLATEFALPIALSKEGIRRYGFHGLSYEYIASILPRVLGPDLAEGRVVVAHLGSGASLCAMRRRRSIATTMGFTALDGLMMARRCGTIDPGVILYLLSQKGLSVQETEDLLYNRCGLLGVSGISDDMRELLASHEPDAKHAINLFVYRAGRELGSLVAALGGLDALIFTAGIGENAPAVRQAICEGASWLGIKLDEKANQTGGPCISDSKVSAWVVPTNEDLMIAQHTLALMERAQSLRQKAKDT